MDQVATETMMHASASTELAKLLAGGAGAMHRSEPLGSRLLAGRATRMQQRLGRLADLAWVATAIGYLKDIQAVQDMRKRAGAPAKEEGPLRKPPKKPKREVPPNKQTGPPPKG